MPDGIADNMRAQGRSPEGARTTEIQGRLILATIGCIEQYGLVGATVRRITTAAGANIASVNYHFGSKEALLAEVFAATLHEAFPKALGELRDAIAVAGGDVRAGTSRFLTEYLPYSFRYPRLAVAHLQDALASGDCSGPAIGELRTFLRGFEATIAPAMPMGTPGARRIAVVQAWGIIMQMAMLREAYDLSLEDATGPAMVEGILVLLFRGLGGGPPVRRPVRGGTRDIQRG